MKFTPRKPRDDVNVSDTHPLEEAGILIVGLTALFAAIAIVLVFMVDIALTFVSADDEAALFDTWAPADMAAVEDDDQRVIATQSLVDRLAQHWPESPYTFRVAIDDSDTPNALAFPGGTIMVTTGLLESVESENELAFVLGHELGHFRNRDHIRGLGRGLVIALVFAVATGSEGDFSFAVTIADLALRSFGREQESDADEFGLSIVNAEYGHVNGASEFFRRLAEEGETFAFAEYLSTHPDPDDRIVELVEVASRNGYAIDGELADLK